MYAANPPLTVSHICFMQQMLFSDCYGSLNPLVKVLSIFTEHHVTAHILRCLVLYLASIRVCTGVGDVVIVSNIILAVLVN